VPSFASAEAVIYYYEKPPLKKTQTFLKAVFTLIKKPQIKPLLQMQI